jgi:membrane-associated protein
MSELTDTLLTAVLVYGPLALALTLALAALGLPLPATLLVLAAGAFVQQGVLDAGSTALLALGGTMLGDSGGYGLGRLGERWLPGRITSSATWRRAAARFSDWGGWAIVITRFLLTPLGPATSIIAGSSHYAFGRFLAFDLLGELIWIALFGGLGYSFATSWELLSDLASSLSGLLLGIVVLLLGGVLAVRTRRARQARARPQL